MGVAGRVAEQVEARLGTEGLWFFPDSLASVDGETVAGFRPETQPLRVAAQAHGVNVELVVPDGAKAGQYTEHAADWVLPLVLSIPAQVSADLFVSYLRARLQGWRDAGESRTPTVRYRELFIDGGTGSVRQREIEGPADGVLEWLEIRDDDAGQLPSSSEDTPA